MQIIATVRKGHKVNIDNKAWSVIGSQSFRSGYFYILRDVNGSKGSITRENLIQGQQDGTVTVTA